jgi:type I restriction enzyme, S subunit
VSWPFVGFPMSLLKYPKYKDSGIPWVGTMPSEWHVTPLLGVAQERFESNEEMREENLLSLSYGRIVRKDMSSNDGLLPESYGTYQVVYPGDVVFRLTDLQNDKRSLRTAPVTEKGIITSAYLAVMPRGIDAGYFAYLLRCYDLTKVFYSMGGGLRQSMKYDDVKRLPIIVPPVEDQGAIADFLDRETAKIDALIAEQEKLLALLAEKRQAAISHAVTRGLDPDVPMKDSGIPWLDAVPAHWGVSRLKYVTEAIVDCPHETPVYDPGGDYLVIRTADIERGVLDPEGMYRLDRAQYEARTRRSSLAAEDIVYGREGERWGHAALVPESDRYCLGQRMMQFRPSEESCPRFLMWQLNSEGTYRQGALDTVGATSPHVNVSTIRNFLLARPPIEEQRAIAAYLDAQSVRFDALQAEAERAVELLREHRSVLISAAVTGKIDVRDLMGQRRAA